LSWLKELVSRLLARLSHAIQGPEHHGDGVVIRERGGVRRPFQGDSGAHGQHDHEPDLQRPGAYGMDDEVGHGQADHDAADELERAPAAMLVADAQADHRGDRREDRLVVVERQEQRDVVRGHRCGRGLRDGQQTRPQAADRQRRLRAR